MKVPPINQTSDIKPKKVEINEWLDGKVEININKNIKKNEKKTESRLLQKIIDFIGYTNGALKHFPKWVDNRGGKSKNY